MLDNQALKNQLPSVVESLAQRGFFFDTQRFLQLEQARKAEQTALEQYQARRKQLAKDIGILKMQGKDAQHLLDEANHLNTQLDETSRVFAITQAELEQFLLNIPNLAHASVPLGKDEQDNVEVRRVGIIPTFDFVPQDHVDVGLNLGLDAESGAKLAGARFTVLRGGIAQLHRALAQFMLDTHTQKHGYTECYTPYLVNAQTLIGTGQLPKFEADLFALKHNDSVLYLIPTSEVSLTNLVRDSLLKESDLPLCFTAHTPCFRSEAGAYGKDVRGMIRQHQFDKVEMVQIVHPQDSYLALERMVSHAEAILQALGLAYRVMLLCTGDMGFGASKTYDLEVWLPGQNTYREISSISNCEAFQARRLQARFKDKQGKNTWLHTLNGSGLAVGRTLVAVLENYQQADGSVVIPAVLRPYLQGREVLSSGA